MKYGLIGKTLKHSYSKIIHEMFGKYIYDLVSLEENEIEAFSKNHEYAGFNVTIPYKKTIIPYCTEISEEAKKIGSVNTVIRKSDGLLYGFNTDYAGFAALSKRAGISFEGKKVAILGSGGTYNTAFCVVKDSGAKEIISVSRSGDFNYSNIDKWCDCEIIVNTTPVGMYPDNGNSVISLKNFKKCEGVIDVIYNPLDTRLVFEAKQNGIKATGGLYMLVYQAKEAFEIFTGKKIPDEVTEKVYKSLLDDMTNIVLIGMPGCGKSTLGKELSTRLGKELIDIDEMIIAKRDMSIPKIFEKYGEDNFRDTESECALIAGSNTKKIISCGGGIIKRPENLYALSQNGKIYYIKREIKELATEGRPLSTSIERLYEMEAERAPLYESFADFTVFNDSTIEKLADTVLNSFK